MRRIYIDFSTSENDEKQISCSRDKNRASMLWKKTKRHDKAKSTSTHKLVVKKAEHYLHILIITGRVGKYSTFWYRNVNLQGFSNIMVDI